MWEFNGKKSDDHYKEMVFTANHPEFLGKLEKPYDDFVKYMKDEFSDFQRSSTARLLEQIAEEGGGFEKSDAECDEARQAGNHENCEGNFKESLKLYYKALAYAKTNEKKAICYENIAKVFFQTNEMELSLAAIKNAKKLTNASELRVMLSEKEKQCHEVLNRIPESNFPKSLPLTYPRSTKNPEVVDCIEIGPEGKLVTNIDLKLGDVIVVTKPFIMGGNDNLELSECYTNCQNCWRSTLETVISVCDHCVKTVYCSEICKSENSDFHRMICHHISLFQSANNYIEKMALVFAHKLLSRGVDIRADKFRYRNTSPFDWEGGSFENKVKAICSLPRLHSWEEYPKYLAFNRFFIMLNELKKSVHFKALLANFENGEELFFKTFWRGHEVISRNSVTFNVALDYELPTYFDLCLGFFKSSSTANVSVLRDDRNNVIHYVVTERIKSGDDLTVAYL